MKKIGKKILVIALALSLCVGVGSLFAGCGGGKTELYVAAHEGAYGKAFWKDIEKQFEKLYPDVDVKITAASDINTTLQTQLGTKLSPDVVYLGTNQFSGFVNNNIVQTKDKTLLMDLTGVLDDKIPGEDVTLRSKIDPNFLGGKATNPFDDNKTYMLPLFYTVNGIFYNKQLVDEANLPDTYAEMAALTLKPNNVSAKTFGYPRGGYLDNLMLAGAKATLSAADFTEWMKNGYTETMYADNGEYAALFNALAGLKDVFMDGFDPVAGTLTDVTMNTRKFYDGKVAFFVGGSMMPADAKSWKVMASDKAVDDFNKANVGFMAFPTVKADQTKYVGSMIEQVYPIKTGDSKREDLAKKFVAYLYSDAAVKTMAKNNAMVPVNGAKTLAQAGGMDAFTLGLYGVVDSATPIFETLPNATIPDTERNFKTAACFGMNNAMGVAEPTRTGAEWFTQVKTWATDYKNAKA